jgi:predicted RNase H-like HicB family nuclease
MRKYLVVYEKTKTGYSAYVPDMPGVIATGKTKSATAKNIYAAIQFHIEGLKEENIKIPKAEAESEVLVFPS